MNQNVSTTTPEKRSYTVEEICQILHIGRSRAMELCTCGAFRVVRIRRSLRISKKSFDAWLDQGILERRTAE